MNSKRRLKKNNRKTKRNKSKKTMRRGGNGKQCNLSFNYITKAANLPNHGYK